jgi:adenylate cyclase
VVFEGVRATTRRNIFLTAAVLSLSVLFIWFFSRTISRPLKRLARAAEQIEAGNFEIELEAKTQDEVGMVTGSFTRMGKALEVFARFTNRSIAVRAMRGEIRPGGFPKNGTILFSDIRGFTAISENITARFGDDAPDKIVAWLNEYLTHMVACVEKTGGVVDKFIGDSVMAHWGTASTLGGPAVDAFACVSAALGMRAALLALNSGHGRDNPEKPWIRIGCGINTGIVTAGQIGSERRMEYTVIGDPVNLASRTEALNKPFGTDILITENTGRLIGNRLIIQEMPPVSVKGKEKPVRMFAVVNVRDGVQIPGLASGSRAAELAAGPKGPRTLADLRRLLGLTPPNLSQVNPANGEKKYKIGSTDK